MNVTRRVMFLPAAPDGCAFVRMLVPHFRYPQSGYFQCGPNVKGDLNMLRNYQVVMTQRQMTEDNLQGQENLKKAGVKYVMDLDDDFWHVPRYNPAFRIFQNRDVLRNLERAIRGADWVTCSTEFLAKVIARKSGRRNGVTVVENAADPVLFHRVRRRVEKDTVTVGWSGTNTHLLDVQPALEALWRVMRRHHQVRFETLGFGDIPSLIREEFSESRFGHTPWVDMHRYPAYMSSRDWDFTLAPLLLTAFNEAKSCIKQIESGACELPCLSSDVPEYRKYMGDDEVLHEHLIVNPTDQADWEAKLTRLVEDRPLREELGQRMHLRFLQSYDIRMRINEWNRVFEEC